MLPLTGVKVVEIANNVAGPYAGFILAALGADVLKVERPEGGDDARGWGPPFWRGTSATFQALNVNKRGVTLDLKQTADVVRLKAILSEADVLVHNLRPGVLGGLGLGSAALAALNERLVYCAISAFGASGPLQASVGYEPIVQAFAGLFSINGYPDRPGARMGTSVLDLGSATWAALGCIAALLQREKSGRGCVVDTSLLETALGLLTVHFARFQASGKVPERHPSGSLAVVIFEAFETADGQVIVAAANDRLFAKLASEVGHPEWIEDIRYKTNADRHANKMALLTEVRAIMRRETSAAWVARLEKAGVPCSAINDLPAMRAHPQTEALGMVQPVPEIDLGLLSLPLSLDGERPAIRARAPQLGEHNAELDAPWTGKQG
jgi:crotonobetainyl-CoA:carnitine CoA-transferase CaiB-like acyl-CoA transferase